MSEVDGKKQDQVVHDITVPIHGGMHVCDGNPGVRLDLHSSIAAGAGANVSRLELGVHTGTHVDAPLHFIEGGAGTESLDLETLIGLASVVDATAVSGNLDADACCGSRDPTAPPPGRFFDRRPTARVSAVVARSSSHR